MGLFSGISNVFKSVGTAINPIMPLLGVGSELVGAFSAKSAQEEANETNIMLQRENRSWEEEMSNTAHQREVKDLKAAGLNPILSVNKSGAVTPSVQPAQVESLAPVYQNTARSFREAAISRENLLADLQVKRSQVLANSAIAAKNNADANYANTSPIVTGKQIGRAHV